MARVLGDEHLSLSRFVSLFGWIGKEFPGFMPNVATTIATSKRVLYDSQNENTKDLKGIL